MKLIGDDQIDGAGTGEGMQLSHTVRRSPELWPAVHHGHVRSHFGQRQGPVDSRVATSCNDHPPPPIVLPACDEVVHTVARRLALEALDALEWRSIRSERADPRRDNDGRRLHADANGAMDLPASPVSRREAGDLMTQMIYRIERRGLFRESRDEFGGENAGVAGYVEDRLLRIEGHALSTCHIEYIEHMTAHAEHATLEDREQADRTGTDDDDIGAEYFGRHERSPLHVVLGHPAARAEWSGKTMRSSMDEASATPAGANVGQREPTPLRIELALADEAATEALAARLSANSRCRDVFALRGELGAGKTVFARAFIRARTFPEEEVPSPTFTLVQIYEPSAPAASAIWHFDLFRLEIAEDALELGIEDAFSGGISLIEWPDRLGRLLPERRIDLTLSAGLTADSRRVLIEGDDEWRDRLREAGIA
jgi:tRNA threonylcarbamoyladenosine biosynthesis protein TsaE